MDNNVLNRILLADTVVENMDIDALKIHARKSLRDIYERFPSAFDEDAREFPIYEKDCDECSDNCEDCIQE